MHKLFWAVGLGVVLGGVGPSVADGTITFQATLGASCALAVTTPGTLALSSGDTILGSEQTGGTAAVLSIITVGSSTVTVNPPTLTDSPGTYTPTGQQLEYSYTGLSGLGGVSSGGFTSVSKQFTATVLSALQVQNHIVNAQGFTTGHYATQTVVTCS